MKRITKILATVVTAAMVLPFLRGIPVHAAGDIPINASYFPDDGFRQAVTAYDTDGNGYLSEYERTHVRNIHCERMNVYSIQGIEYFPDINGLWCLGNHISSWDLSGNPNLTGIWCSENDFTTLDFSGLHELEWVYCFNCQLTSINFSDNPKLAYVECNSNPNLGSLDVSNNPLLENLYCSSCGLTSLDVSNNPLLCELDCYKNNLTSLNLSNNPNLKRLDVWDNENLGNVDISNLSGLEMYNCARTGITSLDMSANPQLQLLIAGYNSELRSINVTNNPRLADLRLDCDYQLTSLDLSGNPQLYNLYAFGMRDLPAVNISNNPYLIKTYTDGLYHDETQLGRVHSYTIEYGGSEDYFEDLTHCLVVDNGKDVITTGGNPVVVNQCYINGNDGHSDGEAFATRGQAIQALWESAGCPQVDGTSRFNDVTGSPYEAAIKWAETYNIAFGYPNICSDSFCPDELINREDFAIMAHRLAGYMGLGTAFDYGRTDWFTDFYSIDYYGWGAFTWAIQFNVLNTSNNYCYPHGRLTQGELQSGVNTIFNLDGAASYSQRVSANVTPVPAQQVVPYYSGNATSTYVVSGGSNPSYATPTSNYEVPADAGQPAPAAAPAQPVAPAAPTPNASVLGADRPMVSVNYCTHVQNVGWQGYVYNGATSGTEGQSLRLEALAINVESNQNLGIRYRTHVQNVGWQDWVENGVAAGTEGQALRLEALEIELTGDAAANYDVYYRVHVQNIGWMGWVKNGELAGTEGQSLRLEGVQIKILPKDAPTTNLVAYDTHVENIGWTPAVNDGIMSGTVGQSLRLEGIHITVNTPLGIGVEYRTHIQNVGWEETWRANGEMSGTEGQALRLEAIEIRLTGDNAYQYDIYYRTHVQNIGWTDWACNGGSCGSAGFGYRLEGIEILVVPAGTPAPGSTAVPFYQY